MSSVDFTADSPYARFGELAVKATVDARKSFIRKTYAHLTAAVYGLVLIEMLYFKTLPLDEWVPNLFNQKFGWFALFGGYMLISWIAQNWAISGASLGKQYAGLITYVLAFSVILCPMLWIANHFAMQVGGQSYNSITVAAVESLRRALPALMPLKRIAVLMTPVAPPRAPPFIASTPTSFSASPKSLSFLKT